jgi:acyl-CoA thioester hydrolase
MHMLEINIYYEDTDCGGVVYYANYLRYFERARTEYMKSKGICLADFHKQGIIFTVYKAEVRYLSPAYYGETLLISTDIPKQKGARIIFHHVIKNKKDDRIIVTGSAALACVNSEGQPRRLPKEFEN